MRLQKGSALLLVLAMLGIATTVILNVWFLASLQLDIIAEREQWYKKIYAAETVLNTGLALARQRFGLFAESSEPVTFDVTDVLEQADLKVIFDRAHVIIKKPDDKNDSSVVMVTTLCFDQDKVPFQMRCLLRRDRVITAQGNEVQFVVHAFTIGGGV